MPRMPAFDFDRAPFLVIWEVTRACALACVHCRADAIPRRDPRELTTEEGFRLIDQIAEFGDPPPLFVLTGGDPMRRPDLADLVRYAFGKGLIVADDPERHGRGDARTASRAEGRGLVAHCRQSRRRRRGDARRLSGCARVVRLDDENHQVGR